MVHFRFFFPLFIVFLCSCAGIPESYGLESGKSSADEDGRSVSEAAVLNHGDESSGAEVGDSADIEDSENTVPFISSGNSGDNSDPRDSTIPESTGRGPEGTEDPDSGESDSPDRQVRPPLSREDLSAKVIDMVPENLLFVSESRAPMGIYHDLDKNGYDDFLLLAVDNGGRENSEFIEADELRDTGRLFFEKKEYVNYSILIFYQYPGDVKLRYTIPISRQLVLISLETRTIREGRDFPYAVSVSFKTRGGTWEEWIILNGQGISRFVLEETLSVIPVVEDIDGDGFTDLVIHEQAAEEGIGYETFLTWYKWDGSDFTEERSTNIVRNLRKFFNKMAAVLLSGSRAELLDHLLLPESRVEYESEGLSGEEIYELLFRPVDEGGKHVYELDIRDVVYPVLMETPFTYETRGRFEFPFTLGIITDNGGFYFEARLVMNRNPFDSSQFGFLPVE